MKSSDKFLLAIVAGIAVLVIAALVLVLRAPAPSYLPEDTPAGIAHNYILALRQGDFERAHGYISPDLPGAPTVAGLASDVQRNPWQFGGGENTAVSIADSQTFSDGTAHVNVSVTTLNNNLFNSAAYSRTFGLILEPQGDSWRLIHGDDYWDYCWSNEDCDPALRFD